MIWHTSYSTCHLVLDLAAQMYDGAIIMSAAMEKEEVLFQ